MISRPFEAADAKTNKETTPPQIRPHGLNISQRAAMLALLGKLAIGTVACTPSQPQTIEKSGTTGGNGGNLNITTSAGTTSGAGGHGGADTTTGAGGSGGGEACTFDPQKCPPITSVPGLGSIEFCVQPKPRSGGGFGIGQPEEMAVTQVGPNMDCKGTFSMQSPDAASAKGFCTFTSSGDKFIVSVGQYTRPFIQLTQFPKGCATATFERSCGVVADNPVEAALCKENGPWVFDQDISCGEEIDYNTAGCGQFEPFTVTMKIE